jgi:hypothetical protein
LRQVCGNIPIDLRPPLVGFPITAMMRDHVAIPAISDECHK